MVQLVVAELSDPNEAVVLWALKASHQVIPPALGVPSLKVQLISAVEKAAQRLVRGRSSMGRITLWRWKRTPADLIVPMQTLLDWRIKQYAAAVPPEPPADGVAADFLTQRAVWLAQNSAQRLVTVQRIVDLAAGANALLPTTAKQVDHDELLQLLKKIGQVIYVIGYNAGDQALMTASTPLANVDSSSLRFPPPPPRTRRSRHWQSNSPPCNYPKGTSLQRPPPKPHPERR